MLLLPVWSVTPAWYPIAMVLVPVLFRRAPTPTAVLLLPMMLAESACVPVAVLLFDGGVGLERADEGLRRSRRLLLREPPENQSVERFCATAAYQQR
jgi:hypothetical protein